MKELDEDDAAIVFSKNRVMLWVPKNEGMLVKKHVMAAVILTFMLTQNDPKLEALMEEQSSRLNEMMKEIGIGTMIH